MNYVENFNFYGVDAKEIPCIKGEGIPTETMEGAVGCLYMDTNTGTVYKCIAVSDGKCTWETFEGEKGEPGAVFTPSVSADGTLSWTNNGGLANPDPVNIMGNAESIGEIVQTTGYGETAVMSQKAVTEELNDIKNGNINDHSLTSEKQAWLELLTIPDGDVTSLFNGVYETGYVTNDGTIGNNTAYKHIGFINISNMNKVVVKVKSFQSINGVEDTTARDLYMVRYDKDKNFIARAYFKMYPLTAEGTINISVTPPSGVPYPVQNIQRININSDFYGHGMGLEFSASDFNDGTTYIMFTGFMADDTIDISIDDVKDAHKYIVPKNMMPPSIVDIVQTTGDSKTAVMSQKAVTDTINDLYDVNLPVGDITDGKILTTTSYIGNNAKSCITDFVPVKYGDMLRIDDCYLMDSRAICVYDVEQKFVKAIITNSKDTTVTCTIPNDIYYIRVTGRAGIPPKITKINQPIKTDIEYALAEINKLKNPEYADIVLKRNTTAFHNLNAAARYGYHSSTWNANKRFTALITTDLHHSEMQFKNAIDILNESQVIDCGFCLGDIQGSNFVDDATWYTDLVNTSNKPFYTILGNHDCGNYSAGMEMTGGTPTESFSKFIQPTLGIIGDETITTPYYKLQYDDYKLVVICLNNYDAPTDKDADDKFVVHRGAECFSEAQIEWFIETLHNIPSDYHLIIAQHSFAGTNDPIENDDWSQNNGALSGDKIVYTDTNIVPDIVNAWKNGTSLTKTYTPKTEYALCPTHNIIVDFSTRGAGNFICYLVGHSHRDEIRKSRVYNDQIVVAFCSSALDRAQNKLCDLPRVRGERSEDAITAVTVDVNEKKIRLVRFGSDITFDLKKREYTSISY